MWAVVTVVFSGYSAAFCSFNTKQKKSADCESKRDLRMSSFTTVLRSTNWASGRYTVVLSHRFVWWSDCLWFFSCQFTAAFPLVVLWSFLSLVILLGILNFSFLKSVFSVTRIRFRTYGYLLSILTFALPNGLPPAIYAFCLGIFVGWNEVVWPNIFSSWIRQKSWSAMWAVVTLVFFLDFPQPIVPSTQKRKIPPTPNRTRDLRMSSFITVLRSTKWAIGR